MLLFPFRKRGKRMVDAAQAPSTYLRGRRWLALCRVSCVR